MAFQKPESFKPGRLERQTNRMNEFLSGSGDTLRALGEEHGFDKETCDEIAELPFDEAFETAYGYLVQAGFDPDEILADFIEPADE